MVCSTTHWEPCSPRRVEERCVGPDKAHRHRTHAGRSHGRRGRGRYGRPIRPTATRPVSGRRVHGTAHRAGSNPRSTSIAHRGCNWHSGQSALPGNYLQGCLRAFGRSQTAATNESHPAIQSRLRVHQRSGPKSTTREAGRSTVARLPAQCRRLQQPAQIVPPNRSRARSSDKSAPQHRWPVDAAAPHRW